MADAMKEIELNIKMREIKAKLDNTQNMAEIGDIIDSLTEEEVRELLRIYVYDR